MTTRILHFLFLLALALSVTPGRGFAVEKQAQRESATEAAPEKVSKDDYLLLPQDVIKIQVFQEEDINKQGEVAISQEFTVVLPLIGTVNLRGKTVHQAGEIIRGLYDRDFLVNPQISVTVMKYAERTVNIIGAVNTAGRVSFPEERGLSIVDAISLAGGPNRLADLKKVKLTRTRPNGEAESITINVDEMTKGGAGNPVALLPDDVVFVPERIF